MLIDIHKHKKSNSGNLEFIVEMFSVGIHPWDLNSLEDLEHFKIKFNQKKNQLPQNFLAVGECGLDRRRVGIVNIAFQLEVLKWHLLWALEIQRPIIIHCVRAESDILQLLKELNYQGIILFHDFAGNEQILKNLLKFKSYFSYGPGLLKDSCQKQLSLKSTPLDRLFFETDDQADISIEQIYQKGSSILNLNPLELEKQIQLNLFSFFRDLNNVSSSNLINLLSMRLTTQN